MNEGNLIASAGERITQFTNGILGIVGIPLQGRQDRQNLKADVAAIKELQQTGLGFERYGGLAADIDGIERNADKERERVETNILTALSKLIPVVDWENVELDHFNPEFRYRWVFEASNVSDDTLQNLWVQLMRGELESPGSVSNDTMTVARDMTKERAEEFQALCSAGLYDLSGRPRIVVGCGNPGQDPLRPYGLSYDILMRLAHHRLIINEMNSLLNINGVPRPLFVGTHQGQTWAFHSSTETTADDPSRPIKGILFTPAGEELARVVEQIPLPEYTKAMFADLNNQGWTALPVPRSS